MQSVGKSAQLLKFTEGGAYSNYWVWKINSFSGAIGPPGWGFDVPLATALCKNLPAENTQR